MANDGAWTLIVPAGGEGASLARTFAGSVGRALEIDAERVEDLKLVLSELCANAAEHGGGTTTIALRPREGSLGARCEGAGPPASADDGFRGQLVGSLAHDLSWSASGVVTFSI